MKAVRWTLFASLLLVALMLVPGGAHVLSLPNKIGMDAPDYFVAQQAYRGWAYLGAFVFGAITATAILVFEVRRVRGMRNPTLLALGCLVATQLIFWTLNFPANRETDNWTLLTVDWESLRLRWEVGHAASAALTLGALLALLTADMRVDRLDDTALSPAS